MMRKIGILTTVLLTIAFVFTVGDAPATPVHIENAGFEEPSFTNPDGWSYGAPTGWTKIGPDSGSGRVGTWRVTDDDFDDLDPQPDEQRFAPEGQNVAFTETPLTDPGIVGLGQTLGTQFAAGKNYTLTVEVGNSWEYYWSGYSVQLLAGGTVIAEDYNDIGSTDPDYDIEHPDYMKWATSTVEYIYDPLNFNDSLVGKFLEIRLLNLGLNLDNADITDSSVFSFTKWQWVPNLNDPTYVGVEFDNVRLENDTIPTPEPATMLLLGTGLLGLAGFGRKKLFRK